MFKKEVLDRVIIAGIVLSVLVGLFIYNQSSKNKSLGFFADGYKNVSTITNVSVNPTKNGSNVASSTLILVANDSRSYVNCTNVSGPSGGVGVTGVPISIVLGPNATLGYGATTTGNFGIVLSPMASTTSSMSYFEINKDNPFTGTIYASAVGTSSISCIEN